MNRFSAFKNEPAFYYYAGEIKPGGKILCKVYLTVKGFAVRTMAAYLFHYLFFHTHYIAKYSFFNLN